MEHKNRDALFEDTIVAEKQAKRAFVNQYSPFCDFVYYPSSITPGLRLAMRVTKPAKPGPILASTHGWHMSASPFVHKDVPDEGNEYLQLEIDMRGRVWSDGKQDCNGLELCDVIDGIEFARAHYAFYIREPDVVFFDAGSGGGGNALALAGKFPDYFAAITATSGISDYALWYANDEIGEFRDELDIWVGPYDRENPMPYAARSGLTVVENLLSPLCLVHGETDQRVPAEHARQYVRRAGEAGKAGLVTYLELAGVGTRAHFGNETDAQQARRLALPKQHRKQNAQARLVPDRGEMVVAGYLFTKKFSVILDCLDKVARIAYDIPENCFVISSSVAGAALVRLASGREMEIPFGPQWLR